MRRILALVGVLLFSYTGFSQITTATIAGRVTDPTKAVILDAKVTAINAGTNVRYEKLTDSTGSYTIPSLPPGTYRIEVEKTGFRSIIKPDVILHVQDAVVINFEMALGSAAENITVSTEAQLIEPTKVEVSRVIELQQIESLPNIGRNFVDFVKLSSAVAPGRENVGGGAFKEPDTGVGSAAAPRLAFGGQNELHTMILVDGVDNVQTITGLPRATPSQEAAQEFRILNSSFLAEYGRALGGFVNIVTKSGNNDFHGSAYYFGINQALNAKPLLTGPNPALRQNQYGANLGGPILKDKTFFFGNYEGQRRAESNRFSEVLRANLGPIDGSMPNTINEVKKFYHLTPEVPDLLRTNDYDSFLGKVDHKLSTGNSIAVRYNLLDSTTHGFLGGGGRASPASTTARNNFVLDQSLMASETAVIGSKLVNDLRFQYARRTFDFIPVVKEPDLEISNLILTGKSSSDADFYRETRVQVAEGLSWISGGHTLKVGADFNVLRDTAKWDIFDPARVIFTTLSAPPGAPSFFNHIPVVFWWPLLNPLLSNNQTQRPALPVPFTTDIPTEYVPWKVASVNHNAYGFFVQDEFKATPKLTLTYGLRYDFETYPEDIIINNDWNNLQPRVGLAYSPDARTVVRAGFGIFNSHLASSGLGQSILTKIWSSAATPGNLSNIALLYPDGVAPGIGRFINPTVRGPVLAPAATLTFTTSGKVPNLTDPGVSTAGLSDALIAHPRTPYAEQASLEISREIGGGVAVSANYLFVHALKLGARTGMLNGVVDGLLPSGKVHYANQRRFPAVGDLFVNESSGYSNYNGGSFKVEKRFAHGFSFNSSYTFSKTISDSESVAAVNDFPEGISRAAERALSRQDVRHRYTLTFVSQVPPSVPGLRNFKFSSLFSAQSGRFFNVFAGLDANNDGNPTSDRPGNLGRNSLEGPGFASVDFRVAREFAVREHLHAEFTLDFFNALNRTNVTDLNTLYGGTDLSKPPDPNLGYGSPRDTSNSRQIQYGFKIRF